MRQVTSVIYCDKILREQATWMVGYTQMRDGRRTPVAAQIIPYEKDTLSGYIVMDETGYGVHFLGVLPGRDNLLKVSTECDCEVDVAAITNLLTGITVTN